MQESDAAYLWGLGLGEPHPISAMHGRGTGDLLDAVMEILPAESAVAEATPTDGPHRIAEPTCCPNVGKSSLLNKLVGAERVVVDSLAGTTRDPVDEHVELDGPHNLPSVDTAGIRRRARSASSPSGVPSTSTSASGGALHDLRSGGQQRRDVPGAAASGQEDAGRRRGGHRVLRDVGRSAARRDVREVRVVPDRVEAPELRDASAPREARSCSGATAPSRSSMSHRAGRDAR